MKYSIGEVAKSLNIPISTLRYYDKEGLFLNMKKDKSGNRIFTENHIETLKVIHCLKMSGLQIKDIKEFMYLASLGDESILKRKEIFLKQKENVLQKINELKEALELIEFKCWYYETASKEKSEEKVKNYPQEKMPKQIRNIYQKIHQI